jgi:hypothetical protein
MKTAITIEEALDSLALRCHAADLDQLHEILLSKLEWRSRVTRDILCLGPTEFDSPDFT